MEMFLMKIRRQDDPEGLPYWEKFEVPHEFGMTVARALESIGELIDHSEVSGVSPVCFDHACNKGVCGSCTMLINGKVALACKTRIDDLSSPITVSPLTKFSVVRDLKVDRDRLADAFEKCMLWVELDDYELRSVDVEGAASGDAVDYEGCVMCGACLEACPQVSDRSAYIGAYAFGNMMAFCNTPHGKRDEDVRLAHAAERGGVSDCAGVMNCERVCPSGIELSKAIGTLNFKSMAGSLRRYFRG